MDHWKIAVAVLGFFGAIMVTEIIWLSSEIREVSERVSRIEALHEPIPEAHHKN